MWFYGWMGEITYRSYRSYRFLQWIEQNLDSQKPDSSAEVSTVGTSFGGYPILIHFTLFYTAITHKTSCFLWVHSQPPRARLTRARWAQESRAPKQPWNQRMRRLVVPERTIRLRELGCSRSRVCYRAVPMCVASNIRYLSLGWNHWFFSGASCEILVWTSMRMSPFYAFS